MLTFNLKKEWFDKIKSGEKTHEYREVKPYWTKRLQHDLRVLYLISINDYKYRCDDDLLIIFCEGYPAETDTDKRIKAKLKSIKLVNGKTTDLKIDKPVYDIEFELIKE